MTWVGGEKFQCRVESQRRQPNRAWQRPQRMISNAVAGANGLVRVTIANHGYSSGDSFFVIGLTGNLNSANIAPQALYQVNVIDANTFDLLGTTFPAGVTFSSGSGYRESFYIITAVNSPVSLTISNPPAAAARHL